MLLGMIFALLCFCLIIHLLCRCFFWQPDANFAEILQLTHETDTATEAKLLNIIGRARDLINQEQQSYPKVSSPIVAAEGGGGGCVEECCSN